MSRIFSVVVALPLALPASDATLYVDGSVSASGHGTSWATAFKTIQEGTSAHSDGDTVIVAQGTYHENINLDGKSIVLRSADPVDAGAVAATVTDGNRAGSVVTFERTEDEACVLSGFTVRNGIGAEFRIDGGIWGNLGHRDSRDDPGQRDHGQVS